MGNKELENRLKEGASLIINFKNNVFNFDYNGNRYERDEEDEEILKTYYNNDEYKNPESGIRLPENSNKHRENPTFESATLLSGLSKLIW
ncbi:MAG: hypothetical protein LBD11_06120 [Candidatus Peribacteria bacterium]|jgi:hypothetical protein|nr:hypothetical protein [Candidatus Peribacteria bacterium]